jgi:hypothetical protein
MATEFPIGGPRKVVYDALKSRGFTMSNWSDKFWSNGTVEARVYGSGSRLQIVQSESTIDDGPMGEVLDRLDLQAVV